MARALSFKVLMTTLCVAALACRLSVGTAFANAGLGPDDAPGGASAPAPLNSNPVIQQIQSSTPQELQNQLIDTIGDEGQAVQELGDDLGYANLSTLGTLTTTFTNLFDDATQLETYNDILTSNLPPSVQASLVLVYRQSLMIDGAIAAVAVGTGPLGWARGLTAIVAINIATATLVKQTIAQQNGQK